MPEVREGTYDFQHGAALPFSFAGIRLTVQLDDEDVEDGFRIRTLEAYPLTVYATSWYAAAAFGIAYAVEGLPPELRRRLRIVTIQHIRWHPVDSSTVVLAHAAAMAVWQALGVTPVDPPSFLAEGTRFVFPRFPGGRPAEPGVELR